MHSYLFNIGSHPEETKSNNTSTETKNRSDIVFFTHKKIKCEKHQFVHIKIWQHIKSNAEPTLRLNGISKTT